MLSETYEYLTAAPDTELRGVLPSLWREVIPFFAGDGEVELNPEGGRTVREYLVPWSLRIPFACQMLGYPYLNSQGKMRRHLPETVEVIIGDDDDSPGYMTANRLKFRGIGGGGEVLGLTLDSNEAQQWHYPSADISNQVSPRGQIYRSWDHAHFQVEFVTQEYDILSIQEIETIYGSHGNDNGSLIDSHEQNRYVVWNDDSKTQVGSVAHADWVFSGTSMPCGKEIGVPYPTGEVTLTWYDVHEDGYSVQNFMQQQGKYNNHTFFDYPLGTLILDSWKRRRRRMPFGNRTVNIEFRFVMRPLGANKFLDQSGTFRDVVLRSDGSRGPIEPGNFNALFHYQYIDA